MLDYRAFRGRVVHICVDCEHGFSPLFLASQGDSIRLVSFQSGLESLPPCRCSFFPVRYLGKGSRPAEASNKNLMVGLHNNMKKGHCVREVGNHCCGAQEEGFYDFLGPLHTRRTDTIQSGCLVNIWL